MRLANILCTLSLMGVGSGLVAQPWAYQFRPAGSFGVPGGIAEIVDATSDGNTLVYTDSGQGEVGVVDITDVTNPTVLARIPVNGEPTGVSIRGPWAVVTVWVDRPDEGQPAPLFAPGELVVIDLTVPSAPLVVGSVPVGWHPDSVKLTVVNGQLTAVVAVENEPVVLDGMGLVTDEDRPGSPNDASPPGLIQVVRVNTQNLANSQVVDVNIPPATAAAAGLFFPTDPQPEFVSIRGNLAAVSLQENNGIAIVRLSGPGAPSLVRVFSLGIAGSRPADLTEDDAIRFSETYPDDVGNTIPFPTDAAGNPVPGGLRGPDAIAFDPSGNVIFSADEGELDFTGGRGLSGWSLLGAQRFDDRTLERLAVTLGQYPEGRSENRGIEVEGLTTGRFGNRDFLFALSERGSFLAVYNVDNPNNPKLIQVLPTGISPEGVVAIPGRGLVVTADEGSGTLTFFQGAPGPYIPSPAQPQLFSLSVNQPFSALSGLCPGFGGLFAVPDNALPTVIQHIDIGGPFARVRPVVQVRLNGQQKAYDGEGICVDNSIVAPFFRGWWLGVEGNRTSEPNLAVQVGLFGNVIREIQLPASIDPAAAAGLPGSAQGPANGGTIRSNGFEGITLSQDGRYLVAAIQREFANEFPTGDKFTRIARYDLQQLSNPALQNGVRVGGDWEFFFYQMDSNDPSNWAGLSEIITAGPDTYVVIERDTEIGLASNLKRIYTISLAGLQPDTDGVPDASDTVSKLLVRDVLGDFFPYEKVEGLAITPNGSLWIGLDNDGGEGENRILNLGPFLNPFGN